jgi:hypothetical protein
MDKDKLDYLYPSGAPFDPDGFPSGSPLLRLLLNDFKSFIEFSVNSSECNERARDYFMSEYRRAHRGIA